MLGLSPVAALGAPPGSSWGCYECLLGLLWGILGQVGAKLGPSWAKLGQVGTKLGLSWG